METLTLNEALARHPGCYFNVVDRADGEGVGRPAIYVWSSEADAEDDDGSRAVAVYWKEE